MSTSHNWYGIPYLVDLNEFWLQSTVLKSPVLGCYIISGLLASKENELQYI